MHDGNIKEMSKRQLVEKYHDAIYKVALKAGRSMRAVGYMDDLYQDAFMVLLNTRDTYDPSRGTKFLTYYLTYGSLHLARMYIQKYIIVPIPASLYHACKDLVDEDGSILKSRLQESETKLPQKYIKHLKRYNSIYIPVSSMDLRFGDNRVPQYNYSVEDIVMEQFDDEIFLSTFLKHLNRLCSVRVVEMLKSILGTGCFEMSMRQYAKKSGVSRSTVSQWYAKNLDSVKRALILTLWETGSDKSVDSL